VVGEGKEERGRREGVKRSKGEGRKVCKEPKVYQDVPKIIMAKEIILIKIEENGTKI